MHKMNDLMKFIWRNKAFLIIWIIIITAIFSYFSLKRPQFKAVLIYEFPESEDYYIKDPEMISTYGKREQFKENLMLLETDSAEQFFQDKSIIIEKKYLDLQVSIEGNDSISFRKTLQQTKSFIDSLYVIAEIKGIEEKLASINTQIWEISSLKEALNNDPKQKQQTEKYAIIARSMKNYSDYLVTKKYSYEKLMADINNEIEIDISSTNKLALIIGGFIFSIWTGLMIALIKYFVQKD